MGLSGLTDSNQAKCVSQIFDWNDNSRIQGNGTTNYCRIFLKKVSSWRKLEEIINKNQLFDKVQNLH